MSRYWIDSYLLKPTQFIACVAHTAALLPWSTVVTICTICFKIKNLYVDHRLSVRYTRLSVNSNYIPTQDLQAAICNGNELVLCEVVVEFLGAFEKLR